MVLTLYMILPSPPVRSVLLCAKALGVELEQKEVNLLEGEHLKPDYLKFNPQHTVPVLDDDGFVLVDSHAINMYLVSKYGKNDNPLYPNDLQKRAVIDHRLHFDSSCLFVRGLVISRGIIFGGEKAISPQLLAALEEAYSITEKFLEKNKFVAGDHLTIADFSLGTSITSWNAFVPFSEAKYPKIAAWIKELEALAYYQEANQEGLDQYYALIKDYLSK